MGRVKDFFWGQINANAAREAGEYEPTPDDELEMLQVDAERAQARYAEALKKKEAGNEPR